MQPIAVHAAKLGKQLQESLAKHGFEAAVKIAIAPGAAMTILKNEGQIEERNRYLVEYCKKNGLTLRDLFMGKGGAADLNNIDMDSVPLQEAAIDMWNSWSNKKKILAIEQSLGNGKTLESMLTDECEQVREGALLYQQKG